MEYEELPEELQSPPEERLVGTQITKNPHPFSMIVSLGMVLFITLITQLYWADFSGMAQYLPAINANIFKQGEIWRAFTAVFIHGDISHLASNMYMLGIFSFFVYGYFGFGMYPLWTFLGAGVVNLISTYTYPPEVRLLGASGWVYLLGGFWLTMYFLIQRQYSFSSRVLRVCGMALMVFFPTSFEATTSYRTHFIGFVVGVAMGLFYFIKNYQSIRSHEKFKWIP